MTSAFPKTMRIQILLSVPLILFGVVAIYLIHRSHSESAQVGFHDLGGGSKATESEQAGSMLYTSSPEDSQAGMPVPPMGKIPHTPGREDEPDKTQELRLETRDQRHESPTSQVSGLKSQVLSLESMAERLEELKYDGYMQVGDMRIAWLSDGKDRIIVGEGGVLDDTIRIDEIHENFLVVSLINQATTGAVDGRIVREILFTRSPDELWEAGTGRQEGQNDRTTGRRGESLRPRVSIASQSKSAARLSDRPSAPPSSGKELPSQYGPPPDSGQTSPGVAQTDGREDFQSSGHGTVIYVDPASRAVKSVGETFTVGIKIDNGSNVFAVPFDINYDPDILEVTGLHEGSYLKKDGGQSTFLTSIDRNKGMITVGLTRLGRIGGVSGSGTLMSIDFRTLKGGTTFLSFANGKPMDSNLNALPVEFVSGELEVE